MASLEESSKMTPSSLISFRRVRLVTTFDQTKLPTGCELSGMIVLSIPDIYA